MHRLDFRKSPLLPVGKTIAATLVLASFGFANCFLAQAQSQPDKQESGDAGHKNQDSEDSVPERSNIDLKTSLNFVEPPVSSDIGDPGQRTAAGARGGCRSTNSEFTASKGKQFTALVPVYKQKEPELVLGETASSHPTFWFYVPYSSPFPAKFVLQDDQHRTMYQESILLARIPGVINFPLPSKVASLKVNHHYHWFLSIYCNQGKPPVFVDGWIKRKELNPSLRTELEKATLSQRVSLLATHGIWYDALTISAQLRRQKSNPHNWAVMLKAIGLENIAFEPILGVIDNSKVSYQEKTGLISVSNRKKIKTIH